MMKGNDIICISSIDWDFIWQTHQEVMASLAANGNRVLFIENTGIRAPQIRDIGRLKKRVLSWFKSARGFREERRGLYIYSPIILPFPYSGLARRINHYFLLNAIKRWMKVMQFRDPIIWTFLPTETALDIIESIGHKLLIYHCVADFLQLSNPKKVGKAEDRLIQKADIIFAQGEVLKKKCQSLNDNVHIFPPGVNMETFADLNNKESAIPEDMKGMRRPIIGYVGGMHKHIDFALLKEMARERPEWTIVIVGPVQVEDVDFTGFSNIHLLGKKDFLQLPQYVQVFDVGIIPYQISHYTETVFPTKLNEYHAMGKPVVSTALPEVIGFNRKNDGIVNISSTHAEFINAVSKALADNDPVVRKKRIESARENTWGARIGKMSDLVEKTLADKDKRIINWRQNFLKFYRISRKRAIKLIGIFFIIYFVIFFTPLLWIIASPLKISQDPKNAESIVVFAGGVGESGKAGQGYEERVKYAAELYKAGDVKYVVFSSGYSYSIKEPEIMKALAISLGIPAQAIILEEKAANTYQNVRYSAAILNDKNIKNAIVVSSPYNMLRISLVAKRIAPDIHFIYAPIPHSRFFGDEKTVELKHIFAIMHEYIGIIYYWAKGYI